MPLKSTSRADLQDLFMERVNHLLLSNDSQAYDLLFVARKMLRSSEIKAFALVADSWDSLEQFRVWAKNPVNRAVLNDVFDAIVAASDALSGWLFEQINGVRLIPDKQSVRQPPSDPTGVDRRADRELLEGKTASLAAILRQADTETLSAIYEVLSEQTRREDGGEDAHDGMPTAALAEQMRQQAARTRPTQPPAWLEKIQPQNPPTDGTNGIHRVIGRWPGEETDAEVEEALARLS